MYASPPLTAPSATSNPAAMKSSSIVAPDCSTLHQLATTIPLDNYGCSRNDHPLRDALGSKTLMASTMRRTMYITEARGPDGFPAGRTIIATIEKIFTPSWFLILNDDVRKKVYWHCLFPNGQDEAPSPLFSARSTWRVKPPPLLQTCQQIRIEALPIYYDEFYVSARNASDLIPWLSSLDLAARMSLGIVSVRWDWTRKRRNTMEKQIDKVYRDLKQAGVEIQKSAIEMYAPPYSRNELDRLAD